MKSPPDPVYMVYGLAQLDIRCRFALCNTTDRSLDEIVVFTPQEVEQQLNYV